MPPISSNAPLPLGAAYVPILLSEVEQEQRPSGNGDREAIVVRAGPCDGEGERAWVPDVSEQDVSATRWRKTFRQLFVAETSLVPKRLHSR